MAHERGGGRRSNEAIDDLSILQPVINQLDEGVALHQVLENAKQTGYYTERDYRAVIKTMRAAILTYLNNNPDDKEIKRLLSNRFDSDELERFRQGEPDEKELLTPKTLKRTLEKVSGSVATLDILRAYWQVERKNAESKSNFDRQIRRVSGIYLELAVHSTNPGKFQISLLKIPSKGSATTRYRDHEGNEQSRELTPEILGTTGLLLREKTEESIIVFYLFIGPDTATRMAMDDDTESIGKPKSLQGVYIYSNKDGNTTANLAVYYRITDEIAKSAEYKEANNFFENYEPMRGQDTLKSLDKLSGFKAHVDPLFRTRTVRENIQYFLHQRARAISSERQNGKPFDFSQQMAPHPGPYHQEAKFYQQYQRLVGDYYLYINERFPADLLGERKVDTHARFSNVARGTMRIITHRASGALRCEVKLLRSVEDKNVHYLYRGCLMNHELNNSNFLVTTLYLQPNQDRCLQLLFSIVDKNHLVGGFNFAYLQLGEVGSGVAIAVRQKFVISTDKESKEEVPITFNKFSSEQSQDTELSPKVAPWETTYFNYLSVIPRAITAAPSFTELAQFRDSLYSGIYRVFAPILPPKSGFRKCLLIIYPNSSVFYADRDHVAQGRIEQPNSNTLNIILRDEQDGNLGFLCIRVNNLNPADKENPPACYLASFAGFQRFGSQTPLAAHIIVEFISRETNASFEEMGRDKDRLEAWSQQKEIHARIIDFFSKDQSEILHHKQIVSTYEEIPLR